MNDRLQPEAVFESQKPLDGVWVEVGVEIDETEYRRAWLEAQLNDYLAPSSAAAGTVRVPFQVPPIDTTVEHHARLTEKQKRRIKRVIAGTILGGVFVGGYDLNLLNVQGLVSGALNNAAAAIGVPHQDMASNGLTMNPLLTNSPESLSTKKCMLPQAEIGVLTLDGSYPVVPVLTSTSHPTPYDAKGYIHKLHSEAFKTASDNPEMVYYRLPLGLTLCDLGGGINKQVGNKYIIDRSKLQIQFEDPSSTNMLSTAINVQPQTSTAKNSILNPSKNEWVSYPVNGLFLYNGTDPKTGKVVDNTLNTSVNNAITTMQDPQTIKVLNSLFESQAINDVANSSVIKNLNVGYPDGINSLKAFVDKALLQRLGVSSGNTTWIDTTDYAIKMDTPIDVTTKMASIKSINLSQKAQITDATMAYGYPTLINPNQSQTPSPTATPTTTPSPTVTNAP